MIDVKKLGYKTYDAPILRRWKSRYKVTDISIETGEIRGSILDVCDGEWVEYGHFKMPVSSFVLLASEIEND